MCMAYLPEEIEVELTVASLEAEVFFCQLDVRLLLRHKDERPEKGATCICCGRFAKQQTLWKVARTAASRFGTLRVRKILSLRCAHLQSGSFIPAQKITFILRQCTTRHTNTCSGKLGKSKIPNIHGQTMLEKIFSLPPCAL
jgi:hypothetical protein